MQRPQDIQQLASAVDRLVTCGGARIPVNSATYLQFLGIAAGGGENDWAWPTQSFLRTALPAADKTDLLRRVVIRDPQYRLHIDLSLCSVIHAVAVAERWQRLEELLFGACQTLAPRFGQLLSWLAVRFDQPVREISTAKIQQAISENAHPSFVKWDVAIWGDSRSPADLFPLLLDLYVPLNQQPFHVSEATDVNHVLLASLIAAANQGEGLSLNSGDADDLQRLQDCGLPIRVERQPNETLYAYIVGRIELVSKTNDTIGELEDVHAGLTNAAKLSDVIQPSTERWSWSVQEWASPGIVAPASLEHDAVRWPQESSADKPEWLQLPGSELISTAARRRKDSPDADVALQQVAAHPLYGFILQMFLMEALDRELGEETLALALPQNRKLESAGDWAETKILYRPRDESNESDDAERDGFLVLGSLDEVIPVIGRMVGIEGIATPYRSDLMPWSRAVYLMSTAGIVDGRPHSWRLTITSFVLDRLHGGRLMKDVIRGGRNFRDQMHIALSELWKEQAKNAKEETIPA
ncbi:hypothetical protein [Roseiconus lacunae]|uniref:Uncharacterized protein n=1 Tax=Roseiconus lacunae TaxID=2605694 RepID=A0ABT7PNW8_9BACT|nr:hypothetical protein [Roseiconus lacunae]MDM4018183.1 hypothetical protein [Roseiconus lacunae]